ncbi:hypothetical protein RF11_12236 [Thelohanellus kitauei]|uniref:Tc1-like transposase DDE domain-containing protein n=1 Tax=Thelohanellus kitauei TaxID=669202 RepID=A0A0C2M777_THEKT|nr:hypothetical protein RF11_12236 [Thelohanellus kitauei]
MRSLTFRFVYEDFKTQREIARTLNILKSTVNSIIKKFEETGQVSGSTRGGARNTIITQQIKDYMIELMNEDLTTNLREIQQQLGVDVAEKAIWKWLKDLGFTYELARSIYEKRNTPDTKLARQNHVRWYFSKTMSFRLRNILFVDKSPFNLHIMRNHGWSRRGRTPNPRVHTRSSNITMILAMNRHNIVNSEAILGSVNTEVFIAFLVETMNVLGQAEQFIFVLDNVNFHHAVTVPDNSTFLNIISSTQLANSQSARRSICFNKIKCTSN